MRWLLHAVPELEHHDRPDEHDAVSGGRTLESATHACLRAVERRIADFYAGLTGDFRNTQRWKRLRTTKHDHHPVHDALGNAEALIRMLDGER